MANQDGIESSVKEISFWLTILLPIGLLFIAAIVVFVLFGL